LKKAGKDKRDGKEQNLIFFGSFFNITENISNYGKTNPRGIPKDKGYKDIRP
jgi:hypothetical protein